MRSLPRWLAGCVLLLVALGGGWFAIERLRPDWIGRTPPPTAASATTMPVPRAAHTVASAPRAAAVAGETPMGERVAVIGHLNKRNGQAREIVMKPGQAFRVGDTIVRLRACERTAPWEEEQLTGAFLQLDVRQSDGRWRRAFSGWTFRERPALNVVQHPVYDVWPKSCAMTFPSTGADTEVVPATPPTRRSSRASKAPSTTAEPDSSPATPSPSAAANSTL
ncbi:hypothetical protein SAMN06297144_3429 [Sphingomonas guangdongensis]|uniref:DUF2155 domain-containing protein n=1 Tax=Sphingomonas guangdongensis TaxID=1141890 RepID=A0A285R3I1_9SPHN|nr:hypothetical protein SAMN06297144_3429 [Sphingomonas guangdongensis]